MLTLPDQESQVQEVQAGQTMCNGQDEAHADHEEACTSLIDLEDAEQVEASPTGAAGFTVQNYDSASTILTVSPAQTAPAAWLSPTQVAPAAWPKGVPAALVRAMAEAMPANRSEAGTVDAVAHRLDIPDGQPVPNSITIKLPSNMTADSMRLAARVFRKLSEAIEDALEFGP